MEQKYTTSKPSWVPEEKNDKFACSVMSGIEGIKDTTVGNINPALVSGKLKPRRKMILSEDDYVEGVAKGDRMTLSRAITLIESNSPRHFAKAQRVLQRLREEQGLVGNLNKSDLINYANSYGRYMDLVKECRQKSFRYVVYTDSGPKPNPIIRMMDDARRDMAASSERLGMTLSGQLKTAKAKADRQEAEMEAKFGVI